MNNEYYGVASTPTEDFLAHYGVRGMKWGVRKAIEKGNNKRLDRHYKMAQKKLKKLNDKANIELQSQKAKKYNKIAKVSGTIGAAGAGTLAGLHLVKDVNNVLENHYTEKVADLSKKYRANDFDSGFRQAKNYYTQALNDAGDRRAFADDALDPRYGGSRGLIGVAARGIAIGGLGTAAVVKGKAMVAKHRTTEKGHAQAVAKRDAWKKEMRSAFKGTQYDASKGSIKKRRKVK